MNCIICKSSLRRSKIYCSTSCQHRHRKIKYIDAWKKGEVTGGSIYRVSWYIKDYLRDKFNNKCTQCGWSKENPITRKVPLEVEHLDGDWRNNKEDNLTLLCPNCHSLTPTYRALNKGNGRHSALRKLGKSTLGK